MAGQLADKVDLDETSTTFASVSVSHTELLFESMPSYSTSGSSCLCRNQCFSDPSLLLQSASKSPLPRIAAAIARSFFMFNYRHFLISQFSCCITRAAECLSICFQCAWTWVSALYSTTAQQHDSTTARQHDSSPRFHTFRQTLTHAVSVSVNIKTPQNGCQW